MPVGVSLAVVVLCPAIAVVVRARPLRRSQAGDAPLSGTFTMTYDPSSGCQSDWPTGCTSADTTELRSDATAAEMEAAVMTLGAAGTVQVTRTRPRGTCRNLQSSPGRRWCWRTCQWGRRRSCQRGFSPAYCPKRSPNALSSGRSLPQLSPQLLILAGRCCCTFCKWLLLLQATGNPGVFGKWLLLLLQLLVLLQLLLILACG